jgi:hypothetical protein
VRRRSETRADADGRPEAKHCTVAWVTILIDRAASERWAPDAATQLTINSEHVGYVEVVVRVDPTLDSVYLVRLHMASGEVLPLYDGPDTLLAWSLVEQLREAGLPVSLDRPEFLGQLQGNKIRSVAADQGELARWEIHGRAGDVRATLIRPHDSSSPPGTSAWWFCLEPSGAPLEGWPQQHASLRDAVVAVVDQLAPESEPES